MAHGLGTPALINEQLFDRLCSFLLKIGPLVRDIVHHYDIVSMEKSDLFDVISIQYLCAGIQVY